jgi:anti-anti-sigma regulatory factor
VVLDFADVVFMPTLVAGLLIAVVGHLQDRAASE